MCARFVVTAEQNLETTMLQVVVVRGINPAGACIVAHQMYTAVPKPVVQTSLDQMQHFAQATGGYEYCFDAIAYRFASRADTIMQLCVCFMPAFWYVTPA